MDAGHCVENRRFGVSGFEYEDADTAILAKPVNQRTAGRTGPYDDIIPCREGGSFSNGRSPRFVSDRLKSDAQDGSAVRARFMGYERHGWRRMAMNEQAQQMAGAIDRARQLIAPYDVTVDIPEVEFHFAQSKVGPLTVSRIVSGKMGMIHKPSRKWGEERRFDFKYVRQGRIDFSTRDRQISVGAGEMILVDHDEPFSFQTDENTECLCLMLPERWLIDRSAAWRSALFEVATAARSFAPTLRSLLDEWIKMSCPPTHLVAEQFGGLLSMMYASGLEGVSLRRTRFTETIITVIREHYADPALAPDVAAEIVGISRRHLHFLLAKAGTTFGRELMDARLAGARLMLVSKSHLHRTVAEVAYLHGFTDPGHFARRFRAATGISPGAFRARNTG